MKFFVVVFLLFNISNLEVLAHPGPTIEAETADELADNLLFFRNSMPAGARQFFNKGIAIMLEGRGDRPAHMLLDGVLVGDILKLGLLASGREVGFLNDLDWHEDEGH
jgi:hypothetical protein